MVVLDLLLDLPIMQEALAVDFLEEQVVIQ
jgi:hypothetical protein